MTAGQNAIGLAGLGLVVANYWTGSQRKTLDSALFGSGTAAKAKPALIELAGELLFVAVATILSGIGHAWAVAMGAVVAGLWVLFLIDRTTTKTKATSTAAPAGGVSLV